MEEKIELRSPKVREIIGQIPPFLVRSGISLIFLVIILIIIGSKYFKSPEIVKVQVEIVPKDSSYQLTFKIPANEFKKIKTGATVRVQVAQISNVHNQFFKISYKAEKQSMEVDKKNAYMVSRQTVNKPMVDESGLEIKFRSKVLLEGEINLGKISFYDKVMNYL